MWIHVLTLLDKREKGVSATIYTQRVSNQFQLDVDRHNDQYPPIEIKRFNKAHDRFLLVDDEVYHIGASIKDLGRKWFGSPLCGTLRQLNLSIKSRIDLVIATTDYKNHGVNQSRLYPHIPEFGISLE